MELFSSLFSNYLFFVGLHIIFMVSWMASLFYVVRLFVYHNDILIAMDAGTDEYGGRPGQQAIADHLTMMERRLLTIIASPALILTFTLGFYIGILSGAFALPWLHIKLMLVFALIGYHFYCVGLMLKLRRGKIVMRGRGLRFFNEIAPMIFVGIVFLASTKNPSTAFGATVLVLGVTVGIFALVTVLRGRKQQN